MVSGTARTTWHKGVFARCDERGHIRTPGHHAPASGEIQYESNIIDIGGEKVQLRVPEQMRALGPVLIPLGCPGTPQGAAGGVLLLCTPWANYVNGQGANDRREAVRRHYLLGWPSAALTARRSRGDTRARPEPVGDHRRRWA